MHGQNDTLTAKVDTLTAKVDTLTAKVDSLNTELDSLTTKVNSLHPKYKENEFNVSIGARFNPFLEEKPTDLYFDIYAFVPSFGKRRDTTKVIRKGPRKGTPKVKSKFGFYSIFNQSRIETGFTPSTGLHSRDSMVVSVVQDSMDVVYNSYYRKEKINRQDEIALSFFPTYKVVDRDNFQNYVYIHLEGVYSTATYKTSDSLIGADTTRFHVSLYDDFLDPEGWPYAKEREYTEKNISTFLGAGYTINYDTKYVRFQAFASLGYSIYQYFDERDRSKPTHGAFYSLKFILIEKKTGIKLGGDIRRKDITFKEGDIIKPPSYSVYISKQFSIAKIADFLKTK